MTYHSETLGLPEALITTPLCGLCGDETKVHDDAGWRCKCCDIFYDSCGLPKLQRLNEKRCEHYKMYRFVKAMQHRYRAMAFVDVKHLPTGRIYTVYSLDDETPYGNNTGAFLTNEEPGLSWHLLKELEIVPDDIT